MKKMLLPVLIFTLPFPMLSCAASFDCAKASGATEKLICENADLSKLDDELANIYKIALEKAEDKEDLKRVQIARLQERDKCADAECISSIYSGRIAALSNYVPYTGKLWLRKGGEFPICNLVFNLVDKVGNRHPLIQSVEPLLKIKGVSLPEWKEVSHEEFVRIIFPENHNDKSITDFYKDLFIKYPNFKHYRAKVNYDSQGDFEYVIKSEFNDDSKLNSGAYNVLQDEYILHKNFKQNLYGRFFVYKDETYIFNGETGQKYYSVSKPGQGGYGFNLTTFCTIEPQRQ